jgi:anthranilate phosphoribosyltransferase
MAPIMAGVFGATGSRRTFIIHADDGLDELSVTSPASVLEVRADPDTPDAGFELSEWRVDPTDLGLTPSTMADLKGGDAAFNAKVIRSVLEGEAGAGRDIGILNAAAALMVAGRVSDLASGLTLARESIDSGRAVAVLDALVATSQAALRDQPG